MLLSDTVGFIRDLPHHLIASFKATLEEARQADLLLHVADTSSPGVLNQISSVFDVLEEIGIQEKGMLLILNKIDSLQSREQLEAVLRRYPNAVPISARTGEGMERLALAVSDALSRSFRDVDVEMGVDNGKLMAFLSRHGEVLSKQFQGMRVTIHCRLPQKYLGRISPDEATVTIHDADEQGKEQGKEQSGAIEDVA